jgi:serine/threonine-protein kinase
MPTVNPMPVTDAAGAARLQAFFDVAVELPVAERAAWIDAHVGDVADREALQRLLDADDRDGPLECPADERMQRIGLDDGPPTDAWLGRRIGAFRLTRLIGEGGMAMVFLGEREDGGFRQQVAVKLLRRGLWSPLEQRLFRREQQALASLSHPNITHLVDGGITDDGVPYLILEYVHGVPITEHVAGRACDLRARLALFVVVCRAVAAAHRQLIVHRDLKPANILVDADGQVKLLDFGIAKLLADGGDDARTELAALTPGYAAPEQLAGNAVTTATDVYSLGVVLHELLLGTRPPELARAPRSRGGATPADDSPRTAFAIGRDLDTVLRKALSPEPECRYDTAVALADDIERHLDGQPVRAHPPSVGYRARKFIGRHRVGVVGAVAFVLVLVAATTVSLWQAERARHQSARAATMRDFMMTAFGRASPGSPREGPPRITEVVQDAIRHAKADTRMEPGVRIELLTRLGTILREQGALQDAGDVLDWTVAQAREQLGDADPLTLDAELQRVWVATEAGARDARARADHLFARIPDDLPAMRSSALVQSSTIATQARDFERARRDAGRALALARAQDDPRILGEALGGSFQAHFSANDLRAALADGNALLEASQAAYGPQHWRVAVVHDSLSRVQRRLGDLDTAEAHARSALAIDDAVLDHDDWRRSAHLNALLMVLRARHDYAAAVEVARETLRTNRIAFGEENTKTLREASNLGSLLMGLDRPGEAWPVLQQVADAFRRSAGPLAFESASARANAGLALGMSGQVDAGIAELRGAIADFEAMPKPEHDGHAEACESLADLALARDRVADALGMPECIERELAAIEHPDDYWIGRADLLRAELALRRGNARAALEHLDAAAAVNTSASPDLVLQIEWSLLRARAHHLVGDEAAAAAALAEGRGRMAALKYTPERLRELAALPRSS